ncbi:hypothetical protein C8R47DRAFT_1225441 [Mycena vitilis]|nr:hypothetical protein C8R47DRAFT_1225441 [Mycena vitilis]
MQIVRTGALLLGFTLAITQFPGSNGSNALTNTQTTSTCNGCGEPIGYPPGACGNCCIECNAWDLCIGWGTTCWCNADFYNAAMQCVETYCSPSPAVRPVDEQAAEGFLDQNCKGQNP